MAMEAMSCSANRRTVAVRFISFQWLVNVVVSDDRFMVAASLTAVLLAYVVPAAATANIRICRNLIR